MRAVFHSGDARRLLSERLLAETQASAPLAAPQRFASPAGSPAPQARQAVEAAYRAARGKARSLESAAPSLPDP